MDGRLYDDGQCVGEVVSFLWDERFNKLDLQEWGQECDISRHILSLRDGEVDKECISLLL